MTYDLIVLGGGPAGYRAAERAGGAGMRTLLVEEGGVGGVCLNEGCMPTKSLLYAAKLYEGAKHGGKYGVRTEDITFDHAAALKRKDKVVRTLAAGVKSTLKAHGVSLINGRGVLIGKDAQGYAVLVNGETHTGKRVLIATGSRPIVPPIPGVRKGLENGFVMTSREALAQSAVMNRLIVIGGGVIGLEMACYYRTAGAEVTVVEMLDHIAGDHDAELTAVLKSNYEKKGVKFLLNTRVTEIGAASVTYEADGISGEMQADKALLCIGRRPNTENIGLESVGLAAGNGALETDERMKTGAPDIFAAGDVNGKSMLAHTAYREAEVAVNCMLGVSDTMRYDAIPSVVYTNPELASVGETEATACTKGLDAAAIRLPMRFSGRYLAENEGGDGLCKLILEKKSGRILGAQALCNYSSEFIAAAAVMIERRMTADEARRVVFPHPTVAEILHAALCAPMADVQAGLYVK